MLAPMYSIPRAFMDKVDNNTDCIRNNNERYCLFGAFGDCVCYRRVEQYADKTVGDCFED